MPTNSSEQGERKDIRIITGISPARWCYRGGGNGGFCSGDAKLNLAISKQLPLSWFDELFHGGILCPGTRSASRAVTVLLTGPPGTGKSTLATEMCVRLGQAGFPEMTNKKALYLASEGYPLWNMRNTVSFGMLPDDNAAIELFDIDGSGPDKKIQIRSFRDDAVISRPDLLGAIARAVMPGPSDSGTASKPKAVPPRTPIPPGVFSAIGIVVIDGLNSVPVEKKRIFQKLHEQLVASGPQLIMMILDSSPRKPVSEAWEFASDIVIRLDRDYRSGSHYMVRTIEVLKARYQEHVWGAHQLKLYGKPEPSTSKHPFNTEGGVFIFPSLHYILSRIKSNTTLDSVEEIKPLVTTPLKELNELLGGGLPKGRTTALVGQRGAHKSHLGLMQALHTIEKDNGYSLIISLRDDHQFTMKTLRNIYSTSKKVNDEDARKEIDSLIGQGRLEIAYFTPGYITPEEFFHRLLLGIMRMKNTDPPTPPAAAGQPPVFLLFNSLDQIASRFPLCAEERVFVPAIIQVLASLDVTSIFVAGGLDSTEEGLRNLLSMAELILDFKNETFAAAQIKKSIPQHSAVLKNWAEALTQIPDSIPSTQISVARYAGGRSAGARGMLELVELSEGTESNAHNSSLSGVLKLGLQLVPIN